MEPRQLQSQPPRLTRWDFCNGSEVLHPLRSTAKSEITVSKPRHQNKVNVETWSAQSGKHGRSTVDQGENIPFLGFGSPPLLGFMLSPTDAMSPNTGQGAIPVHTAGQRCGEAFLSLVVWQPSSGQTVASPWNARRKLEFPTNVVAESQIS